MNNRQALLISGGLMALALVYAAILYPHLPDPMPIHWNVRGEIDGWWPKWQAVLLFPGTMGIELLLLQTLPLIPIPGSSVKSFRPTYDYIMVLVTAMLGYFHVVLLQAALRPEMALIPALLGGSYLFFAAIGNVLGKLRPNRWAGVRTPWTMASEEVWVGTHRFTARLWTAGGLIGAAALWLGIPWTFTTALFVPLVLLPILYSFVLYRQLGE